MAASHRIRDLRAFLDASHLLIGGIKTRASQNIHFVFLFQPGQFQLQHPAIETRQRQPDAGKGPSTGIFTLARASSDALPSE